MACWTAYKTYSTDKQTLKAADLDNFRKELTIEQDEKKFDRDFKIAIYHDVKEAIASNNPKVQEACLNLVVNLVKEEELQRGLLSALGTQSAVAKQVDTLLRSEQRFQADTADVAARFATAKVSDKNKLIDVCVFYCEETQGASKAIAEKAKQALDKTGQYNVYVRRLSTLVNSRPGYQIRGSVIKYNSLPGNAKDETNSANNIQQTLKALPELAAINTHAITYQTDWYISVFVY